jgi:MFS family permease
VLISGGLALCAVGLGLLLACGVHSSWTATLPGMILAGIGTGLFNPAGSALALSSVPERHSGLASGINDTFRQAGIPLGVAIYGALVPASAAVGHGSPQAFVDGLHNAALLASGIAAVGALAGARLLVRRRMQTAARSVTESATPDLA